MNFTNFTIYENVDIGGTGTECRLYTNIPDQATYDLILGSNILDSVIFWFQFSYILYLILIYFNVLKNYSSLNDLTKIGVLVQFTIYSIANIISRVFNAYFSNSLVVALWIFPFMILYTFPFSKMLLELMKHIKIKGIED